MDPTPLVVIVVLGIFVVALLDAGGNGAYAIGGLFRPPPELGWPRGVQEEDDVRWGWSRTEGPAGPDDEVTERAAGWQVSLQPVVRRRGDGSRSHPSN